MAPGTRIVPSKPALVMEGERRVLVVSDVHVGFEDAMAAGGVYAGGGGATDDVISDILGIIDSERPDAAVLLGDTKSRVTGIGRGEWEGVPRLLGAMQERCDTYLVPGNHDAGIQRLVPAGVTMTGPAGMVEEGVLLTHGHAMPPDSFAHVERIVMGHVHPVYLEEGSVLDGQRVWVSIRADRGSLFPGRRGSLEVLVVPQFNRYHYAGRRRGGRSTSPIIRRLEGVSGARIATLDGSIIGDASALGRVL